VLALRREPEVRHDRDAGVDEGPDLPGVVGAALELDRGGPALLHEPHGGLEGLGGGDLVGAEGQVGDDQRARRAADHGLGQHQQLVDRDRDGRVVPEDVVGGGVADQEHRDAGLVEHAGRGEVVGGEHRPPLTRVLPLLEVVDADALRQLGG
jgi:hypothetical protein